MNLATYINIMINGICIGGLYGLTSSAFTFQVGSLKMVNFCYGSSVMMSMYLTFFFLQRMVFPIPIMVICVVVFNFCLGFAIRKTVLRNTQDRSMNILCTMGLELIFVNSILFIFTARPVDLNMLGTRIHLTDDINIGLIHVISLGLAAVLLLGFSFFLQNTWTGRAIRSVVQNKEIANLMGINSEKTLDMAFSVSYILIGIGGMMLMMIFSADPQFGGYVTLIGFVVCVVSGLGNLWGAFLTGLIIGIVSASIQTFIGPLYHDPLLFSLFVVILLIRPYGLFVKKSKVASSNI